MILAGRFDAGEMTVFRLPGRKSEKQSEKDKYQDKYQEKSTCKYSESVLL